MHMPRRRLNSFFSGLDAFSIAAFFLVETCLAVTCAYGAEGPSEQPTTPPAAGSEATAQEAHVFFIDDQTGEELERVHGIRALGTTDLEVLINGVLRNGKPVQLLHQAVDEDVTDNTVAQLEFKPYAGGQPPTPPSPSLPLRQLAGAMKAYREERATWQKGILEYRKQLLGGVEEFVRQVTATQAAVAKRFDDMLAARNGRDFNRSDIVGSVLAANHLLGTQGRRILVLNTDAEDRPRKRRPHKAPLTAAELDPGVELIWVNKSGLPDASPLFKGLPNRTYHAYTLREAMELVVGMISSDGTKEGENRRP